MACVENRTSPQRNTFRFLHLSCTMHFLSWIAHSKRLRMFRFFFSQAYLIFTNFEKFNWLWSLCARYILLSVFLRHFSWKTATCRIWYTRVKILFNTRLPLCKWTLIWVKLMMLLNIDSITMLLLLLLNERLRWRLMNWVFHIVL